MGIFLLVLKLMNVPYKNHGHNWMCLMHLPFQYNISFYLTCHHDLMLINYQKRNVERSN
jgi:hypothetical protein